jgi:hypothetical protein
MVCANTYRMSQVSSSHVSCASILCQGRALWPCSNSSQLSKTWNSSRRVVMMLEACRQHARWHTQHACSDRNKKWQFNSSKYWNHKHPHSHTTLAHETTMISCPLQQHNVLSSIQKHSTRQLAGQSGWKLHHSSKPSHSLTDRQQV